MRSVIRDLAIRYVIARSCVKGIVVSEIGKLFPVRACDDIEGPADKWLTA